MLHGPRYQHEKIAVVSMLALFQFREQFDVCFGMQEK